jgi:hypothetical protein
MLISQRVAVGLLGLVIASPTVSQSLTEVIVPQYIQGNQSTNNSRIPYAYAVTLSGLTPNTTYRYFNMIVDSMDGPSSNGTGTSTYDTTPNFTRTTGGNLNTAGAYGEFTTNSGGSVTKWFITESNATARFTPGNSVFMRIMLNDGNNGSLVATRLTTAVSSTVRHFGTTTAHLNFFWGNPLGVISPGQPVEGYQEKNMVLTYDNVAGTGRPLYAAVIESDGVNLSSLSTSLTAFRTNVDGHAGRFGVVNPVGTALRRIEVRSLSNPNTIVRYATSANGTWGSLNTATSTVGAAGAEIPAASLPIVLSQFAAE